MEVDGLELITTLSLSPIRRALSTIAPRPVGRPAGEARRLPMMSFARSLFLVLLCTFVACTRTPRADVVVGNGPDVRSLDPALAQAVSDARVLSSLFEGLVTPDPDKGVPKPGMAERWEQVGLRWRFFLRADLVWSDGTPISAEDLRWSYLRYLDPATGAPLGDFLDSVRGARACRLGQLPAQDVAIEAESPRILGIELASADPCFLQQLAQFPLLPVPRHVVEQHGSAWTQEEHFVSNGPFILQERRLKDRVRVRKNPRWHGASTVRSERIDWLALSNPSTLLNLYVADEIDISMDVPLSAVPTLLAGGAESIGNELRRDPRLAGYFLRINVRAPGFQDARVRRALSLMVDRDELTASVLRGGEIPAATFTPPNIHCGGLPFVGIAPPSATRQTILALLLDGLRAQGLHELPLFELSISTDPVDAQIGEWLQQRFQSFGLRCRILALDGQSLRARMSSGEYALARSTWIADFDDASNFLEVFAGGASTNRTGWSHADYDALLAQARRATSATERLTTLIAAETLLLEESPLIPLFHLVSRTLVKPRVRGFHPNPLEWMNAATLEVTRR